MVEDTQTDATPGTLEDTIAEFVRSREKGGGGRYAQQTERVLNRWADELPATVKTVEDVGEREMRLYTDHLSRRVEARLSDSDTGISGQTAQKYYAYVRAFLTYCLEWDYIADNPAAKAHVTQQLPDENLGTTDDGEQTWSEAERQQLVNFVDERAREAIEDDGLNADRPVRDRAVVYLLGYTAARSAELFAESSDNRRNGVYWSDIDFEARSITVLGKSQDRESMQFPKKVHNALKQYRRVQDPPQEDWPVFPTRHRPTLYGLANEVDVERDEQEIMSFLAEHGQQPPSITTQSVRNLLQRLCENGDINVEGEHEYLKPHGARRGVGKKLYKNHSAEAAQKALRHQDPQTTSEMYADIGAGEVAEIVDDVFDDE